MEFVRFQAARWFMAVMFCWVGMEGTGMAGEALREFEREGLAFQYSAGLKRMGSASTEKIRGMLNQQLQAMGNTQATVIALDVLLKLPVFRVMISKERFASDPTPAYLIQERKAFLTEAQKRGALNSYGNIEETTIAGYPAVALTDVDRGRQGFESNVRILCGRDTWHFTFAGDTRKSYEFYKGHVSQILDSVKISSPCPRSGKVLY